MAHPLQEGVVDASHDFGREEGAAFIGREEVLSFLKERFGAVGLEGHEGEEAAVVDAAEEVAFGVLEAGQVREGQVDTDSVGEVFADVADDVGELQGVAEGDGILAGCLGGTEDREGGESHGAGDAVVVFLEVLPSAEALRMKIRLAAVDNVVEKLRSDLPPIADVTHFRGEMWFVCLWLTEGLVPLLQSDATFVRSAVEVVG